MPITNPIKTPAGYVPAFALGFSGPEGELEIVEATKPLPVAIDAADPLPVVPQFADAPAPIEGSSAHGRPCSPKARSSPPNGKTLTLTGEASATPRYSRRGSMESGA